MIHLLWPDGGLTEGKTWREVEDAVRAQQWHEYSRRAFRVEMRARAKAWSGHPCRAGGSSRSFLLGLAKHGMFVVVDDSAPS